MTGDWADDKAAEVLHLILQSEVSLDDAADVIAGNLRLAEAQGAERGVRNVAVALNVKGEPS